MTMTLEQVRDALKQDIRHLIYLDTQFNMRGETDLKLNEMLSLEARGWVAEGDENGEYTITDEGDRIIEIVLTQPAQSVDVEKVREVIAELRAYNPLADEYSGKYIHPYWADKLTAALQEPGRG